MKTHPARREEVQELSGLSRGSVRVLHWIGLNLSEPRTVKATATQQLRHRSHPEHFHVSALLISAMGVMSCGLSLFDQVIGGMITFHLYQETCFSQQPPSKYFGSFGGKTSHVSLRDAASWSVTGLESNIPEKISSTGRQYLQFFRQDAGHGRREITDMVPLFGWITWLGSSRAELSRSTLTVVYRPTSSRRSVQLCLWFESTCGKCFVGAT